MIGSHTSQTSPRRSPRSILPIVIAVGLGLIASAALGLRTKTKKGQTVEALAEHYYGDASRADIIREANGIAKGAEPKPGTRLEIPSPVIHTVERGESLADIAETYLEAEGAEELVAEVNGLVRGKRPKRGSTLTIFAEVEVKTQGRSAEELAEQLLGDRNLGARIRRYNGIADGAALGERAYLPLVGLKLQTTAPLGDAQLVQKPAAPKPEPAPTKQEPSPTPAPPAPKPAPPPKVKTVVQVEKEQFGFITIKTIPWAKINLDGEPIGSTPIFKRRVSAGKHTVRFVNEEEDVNTVRHFKVKPGKVFKKIWHLK